MMPCSFTEAAARDMEDINRYLQTLPKAPARRIVAELERAIYQVRRFPGTGRLNEKQTKLARTKIYRLVTDPYLVFYSVERQNILVHGVIHGKRDIDTLMGSRHT